MKVDQDQYVNFILNGGQIGKVSLVNRKVRENFELINKIMGRMHRNKRRTPFKICLKEQEQINQQLQCRIIQKQSNMNLHLQVLQNILTHHSSLSILVSTHLHTLAPALTLTHQSLSHTFSQQLLQKQVQIQSRYQVWEVLKLYERRVLDLWRMLVGKEVGIRECLDEGETGGVEKSGGWGKCTRGNLGGFNGWIGQLNNLNVMMDKINIARKQILNLIKIECAQHRLNDIINQTQQINEEKDQNYCLKSTASTFCSKSLNGTQSPSTKFLKPAPSKISQLSQHINNRPTLPIVLLNQQKQKQNINSNPNHRQVQKQNIPPQIPILSPKHTYQDPLTAKIHKLLQKQQKRRLTLLEQYQKLREEYRGCRAQAGVLVKEYVGRSTGRGRFLNKDMNSGGE